MTVTAEANGGVETAELISQRKLSLACGVRKPEGFFGVDISPECDADAVVDLFEFPWPIKADSVRELDCSHLIEHVPHWRPGWHKDGWFLFFDEVYRICRKDAICKFVHPYVMSGRAFWDPTHERYVHEATWLYLNREWRQREGLDHYPTDVDFELLTVDGSWHSDEFATRSEQQQAFARDHYWNTVADLSVTLKALK